MVDRPPLFDISSEERLPYHRITVGFSETLLKGIDGIGFVYMTEEDVVRHRLVKDIIKAYNKNGGNKGGK